jgi:glycerophosphoryl diester phosphodiesterase
VSEWLTRRVIAFAHQGGSFEGPSSTIGAIAHALDAGATAIELDVHATKDRHLVVCHDATVDRTSNHRGAIASMTLDELSEVDNAYWWIEGDVVTLARAPEEYLLRGRAPDDRAHGVATLEEVATTFPDVLLNLDIKGTDPFVEPYEELLANELRRLEIADSVIVASFHDNAMQRFRSLAPNVATSGATDETVAFYVSFLEGSPVMPPVAALQIPPRYGDVDVVTESLVAAAHDAGVAVHVWTINEPEEMARLLDLGVDGIVSDRPTVLSRLLAQRDCGWDGQLAVH